MRTAADEQMGPVPGGRRRHRVTGAGFVSETPPGLVTLGETMALFGATDISQAHRHQRFSLTIAGAESNVAIGASRLGCPSTWFGRVGRDELGDLVVRELRAEGIDVRAVVDDAPTSTMVKIHRTSELARVLYNRRGGAGSQLCPDDIDATAIHAAGVLHVTGITPALGPRPAAAVRAAVEVARAAGVPVSFDVNYRATLWRPDDARAALADLLPQADIVFASELEAQLMTGEESPRAAAKALSARGAAQVVVKLGEHGCLALLDKEFYEQPARSVTVVDLVGAGDAFVAGYLADFIAGSPAPARLKTATDTAAFAVGTRGDWEGLPSRAELALLHADEPVIR
jgi:2-dehydro-3-deoxygluconokinase